jgi:hypothetical protein
LLVAPLIGCNGDRKIWIVVNIKMSDGKLAQMSFDDPSPADVDLQACKQSLKSAAPILMQEIHGMPKASASRFISAKCIQSE